MPTKKPEDDQVYDWVGDNENGLAHLSWLHWDYDFALCGVELDHATAKKAADKARCSWCRDLLDGREIEALW